MAHSEFPYLAAIDLGSNSFHMLIARYVDGEIQPIERLGEKVQLGADMEDGNMAAEAIVRGLGCLAKFQQQLLQYPGVVIRAVGTNALRSAQNREDFIQQAEQILNSPVEVISGEEEARLIYLGVELTVDNHCDSHLVIDIGGGSTELIVGERFDPSVMRSLQMGCVSYQRFFSNGVINRENFQQAYEAATLELAKVRDHYANQWQQCLGSSGTLLAIEQILINYGVSPGGIRREDLDSLQHMLFNFQTLDEINLDGLKEDRRQVFASGLAITVALFDALDINHMRLSYGALREGLLYELVGQLVKSGFNNNCL